MSDKLENKYNILITSAGKRVELLKEFKKELKLHYPQAKIFTVDLNPIMAPACHLSDKSFPVPRVTSADYIDNLLRICKDNNVRLVIPTIDTELSCLAENRLKFSEEGIEIMVPDVEFVSICRDKRKTMNLFSDLGIRNPEIYDKYNPKFPMFAKPYDGSLSTNIHIIKL